MAQRRGDVVHGSFKTDEEGPWKKQRHGRDERKEYKGDAERGGGQYWGGKIFVKVGQMRRNVRTEMI